MSRQNYVEFGKADKAYMKDTPHVPLRQIAEEQIRGKELRVVQHVGPHESYDETRERYKCPK